MKKLGTERNSSIEALKIFGILLIVLNHVVLTLGAAEVPFYSYGDFCLDLRQTTYNNRFLILSMLRYCGEFGNTLFFVCSAWFLLDRDRVDKRKILTMLADVWAVSVLILAGVLIAEKGQLDRNQIMMALLPTTFDNNWYISCYLIFYAVHPLLNRVIFGCSRKLLFRVTAAGVFLYLIVAFLTRLPYHLYGAGTEFFSSRLIVWAVLYFLIAYTKLYAPRLWDSRRLSLLLILLGFAGNFGLVWLTNWISLHFHVMGLALLTWNVSYNPLLIMLVLGLFSMARRVSFRSRTVNYISGLSLFIYIIHENRLLRRIYRPALWEAICRRFGYDRVLGWTLLLTLGIFLAALLCSILYYETVHRLVLRVCARLYPRLAARWRRLEGKVLRAEAPQR